MKNYFADEQIRDLLSGLNKTTRHDADDNPLEDHSVINSEKSIDSIDEITDRVVASRYNKNYVTFPLKFMTHDKDVRDDITNCAYADEESMLLNPSFLKIMKVMNRLFANILGDLIANNQVGPIEFAKVKVKLIRLITGFNKCFPDFPVIFNIDTPSSVGILGIIGALTDIVRWTDHMILSIEHFHYCYFRNIIDKVDDTLAHGSIEKASALIKSYDNISRMYTDGLNIEHGDDAYTEAYKRWSTLINNYNAMITPTILGKYKEYKIENNLDGVFNNIFQYKFGDIIFIIFEEINPYGIIEHEHSYRISIGKQRSDSKDVEWLNPPITPANPKDAYPYSSNDLDRLLAYFSGI